MFYPAAAWAGLPTMETLLSLDGYATKDAALQAGQDSLTRWPDKVPGSLRVIEADDYNAAHGQLKGTTRKR